VDTGIGETLRDARTRRKLDLSQVEADIKIRMRYLRAMENEEWDVLPGGAYTRGFIRTYANYLGLDGERLVDEYRGDDLPAVERGPRRVEPVASGVPTGRTRRVPRRLAVALVSLLMVGLLVAVGLTGGDDDPTSQPGSGESGERGDRAEQRRAQSARPGVALSLAATGEVWVCLLGAGEEPLVDGEILEAGAEAGPFRDEEFTLALGNGEVELTVDGRQADTPPSSSPVGYEIDAGGDLTPLEEGERPDCT
jgi:cytoskeleton protein RodZ